MDQLILGCLVLVTWAASLVYYFLARRAEAQARALLEQTFTLIAAITQALNLARPGAADEALETQDRDEAVRVFEEPGENIERTLQ